MHFEYSACVLVFLTNTLVASISPSNLNIPYFVLTLLGKVNFFLRAGIRLNKILNQAEFKLIVYFIVL